MSVTCIQDIYHCDTCKSALDEHGRNCRHGMLFPLLLLMGNFKKCMNYEFDTEKAAAILLDDFRNGRLGRITLEVPEAV